ncbi:MAG: nuclear transport factor 2 family protein [Bacteroidota bacterium]
MTTDLMMAFAKAWATKDLDTILEFFTEDCIYSPSLRFEGAHEYQGKEAIKKAIQRLILFDNSTASSVSNLLIEGDRGYWQWQYHTATGDTMKGCDFFEFEGDRIKCKNAFRKVIQQ